jgi:hypothetical protein
MARYRADPAFRALVISKAQNRRVSKLGLDGITQPANLLAWLYARDNGICGICSEDVTELEGPMRPSIDHIIPLSKGGLHVVANLWLAHYRCNLEKHAQMPDGEVVETVLLAIQMTEGREIAAPVVTPPKWVPCTGCGKRRYGRPEVRASTLC